MAIRALFHCVGELVIAHILQETPKVLSNLCQKFDDAKSPAAVTVIAPGATSLYFPDHKIVFDPFQLLDLALLATTEDKARLIPIEIKLGRTGPSAKLIRAIQEGCDSSMHTDARFKGNMLTILNRKFKNDAYTKSLLFGRVESLPDVQLSEQWGLITHKTMKKKWQRCNINKLGVFLTLEEDILGDGIVTAEVFNSIVSNLLRSENYYQEWVEQEG